ncbi:MAG: Uma2 family endonuclease [Anaerolineae bacterium]
MGEVDVELEEKAQMTQWEEMRKILLTKDPLAYIPEPVEYPESDGKPMAETDVHIKQIIDLRVSLENHFRDDPQVYVAGNLLLYYAEGDSSQVVSPDVFVVFGVPKGERRTYKVWEEGKGPDVVFEITSRSTWREDLGDKKILYAVLGVQEYFLFDPLEEYLRPPLRGYRLAGEEYRQMPGDFTSSGERRLRSEVLGLELRVEEGRLRLYDLVTGQKLLTPAEMEEARQKAEARAAEEARARQKAEARAAEAEARLSRLEAERAALREEIAKLRAERE